MLLAKNAKRIEYADYRPKGDLVAIYIFDCASGCGKELRAQRATLPRRTGLCVKCVKHKQHEPFRQLYNRMCINAKREGYPTTTLSFEEFKFLTQIGCCFYCDEPIVWKAYGGTAYNLDRLDNSKGYEFNNVVVCCFRCNNLRSNFYSSEEFKAVMKVHEVFMQGSQTDWKELMYYLMSWKDSYAFINNGRTAP